MKVLSASFMINRKAEPSEIKEEFYRQKQHDIECLKYNNYDDDEENKIDPGFANIEDVKFEVINNGAGNLSKDYDLALESSGQGYCQAIYTKNSGGKDVTIVVGWSTE